MYNHGLFLIVAMLLLSLTKCTITCIVITKCTITGPDSYICLCVHVLISLIKYIDIQQFFCVKFIISNEALNCNAAQMKCTRRRFHMERSQLKCFVRTLAREGSPEPIKIHDCIGSLAYMPNEPKWGSQTLYIPVEHVSTS